MTLPPILCGNREHGGWRGSGVGGFPEQRRTSGESAVRAHQQGGGRTRSQKVEPSARSETAATLERIIATRLQGIGKRVERLERYLPHINRHRQENLRITAESLGWKGMIKRAPLW
ncbi:unnamed protein product [Lampetra planeri]